MKLRQIPEIIGERLYKFLALKLKSRRTKAAGSNCVPDSDS